MARKWGLGPFPVFWALFSFLFSGGRPLPIFFLFSSSFGPISCVNGTSQLCPRGWWGERSLSERPWEQFLEPRPRFHRGPKGNVGPGFLLLGLLFQIAPASEIKGAEEAHKKKSHKVSEKPLDGRVSLGHPAGVPAKMPLFWSVFL